MMAKAVEMAVEPFDFVLESDKELPPDEQSTFTFSPLTQREQLNAIDSADASTVDAEGNRVFTSRSFAQAYDIVLEHLIKVQNFPVGNPKPWPTSKKEKIEYLKQFRPIDLFWLGNVVIRKSTLEQEEKNS